MSFILGILVRALIRSLGKSISGRVLVLICVNSVKILNGFEEKFGMYRRKGDAYW